MARTTLANVQLLSDDFADMTAAQMDPHIKSAAHIVTDQIAGDSATTNEKLELIERYLAAHFATVFVREATQEKAGSVGATYGGSRQRGTRLESTRFGQMAISLDDTGALALLNEAKTKKKTASFKSLWTEPEAW